MYGVVLWSDTSDRKAVIWCEDHGDLAFYSGKEDSALSGFDLDAGDLVHFELREERHLRFARNPRLIAEDQYPSLAQELKMLDASPARSAGRPDAGQAPSTATIIPFDLAARSRAARTTLSQTGS